MERITQDRLNELRASVPHCQINDIGELTSDPTNDYAQDLTAYLHHFAAPKRDAAGVRVEGQPCIVCDEPLNPGLFGMGRGGFEWGIAHGHGHCRNCRWPATLYHFIKDRNGEDLATIRGILLQQHPGDIEIRERDAA